MRNGLAVGVLAMILIVGASTSRAQLTSSELAAAENGELPLVPAGQTPLFGSFLSWQQNWQAPLPFDFYPDLPLYDLGNGRYLVDDRSVNYESSSSAAALSPDGPSETSGFAPEAYGCGLWLSISRTASNAVVLTLHNTRLAEPYRIWSITNLSFTNWLVETNLTGASGDTTATLIAMGARSNLFFRASESRDYILNTNTTFTGLGYSDTVGVPPDTMGAVGPSHFVEVLNGTGDNAIAVYDKAGHLVAQTNTAGFFAVRVGGTNYPLSNQLSDQRILYDHQSQRWVATTLDPFGSKQVILAVSNTDSPTNLSSGWSRYLIPVRRDSLFSDFPTLGLDGNGLYLSVLHFANGTNAGQTVVAIKKPEIYEGLFSASVLEVTNGLPVWIIQPAVNFDDVSTNDYAWFVAKGPPDLGTNY